jgi:6-pyruvoyltetrahydropterin/6-carboxytetrahydropterin synthase
LLGHNGHCQNLHGHRYVVEVEVTKTKDAIGQEDNAGCLTDFSVLKSKIGVWLDWHWDHAVLYNVDDRVLSMQLEGSKQRCFGFNGNPTAEAMASLLFSSLIPSMLEDIKCEVVRVRVYETPTCWAEVKHV